METGLLSISHMMLNNFSAYMETQRQSNGNAIMVGGQKPMLNNGINRDQIAYYTNDVNGTDNNQPGKVKPALGS